MFLLEIVRDLCHLLRLYRRASSQIYTLVNVILEAFQVIFDLLSTIFLWIHLTLIKLRRVFVAPLIICDHLLHFALLQVFQKASILDLRTDHLKLDEELFQAIILLRRLLFHTFEVIVPNSMKDFQSLLLRGQSFPESFLDQRHFLVELLELFKDQSLLLLHVKHMHHRFLSWVFFNIRRHSGGTEWDWSLNFASKQPCDVSIFPQRPSQLEVHDKGNVLGFLPPGPHLFFKFISLPARLHSEKKNGLL